MFHLKYSYCAVNGVSGGYSNNLPSDDLSSNDFDPTQASKKAQAPQTSRQDSVPDAENKAEMATKDQVTLPPASNKDDVSVANGAVASFGGELVAMLLKAMQENKKSQRESSLQMGLQAADLTDNQANAIRTQADFQLVADIFEAVGSIVGGALKIAGAAKGGEENMKKGDAAGDIASAIGKLLGAGFSRAASEFSAISKEYEADAQRVNAYRDQLKSVTEDLQDQAKTILSVYQEMSQSSRDTLRKILA